MRTEYIICAVEAAEAGSMHAAAKKLFLTQPSVSSAIASLENELGFKLFDRTKNGVVPTALGRVFVDDAKPVIQFAQRWSAVFSGVSENSDFQGEVTVSDSGDVGNTLLSDLAEQFSAQHPRVRMRFIRVPQILQSLNTGSFDISLLQVLPEHAEATASYLAACGWRMELMYIDDFKAVISTRDPLSQQDSTSLCDLRDRPVSLHPVFPYMDILEDALGRRPNYATPEALVGYVSMGSAVAVMPPIKDKLLRSLVDVGSIRVLPISGVEMPIHYYLIGSSAFFSTPLGSVILADFRRKYAEARDSFFSAEK